ncbi:M1 family metallopeptidase [Flavobacterium sp. Arc2]|uniref:M1 family metallopeptidase n=1 Tax=Flavobacterium sp. Arc2 TaxID=3046685 RepID=UPI00352E04C7
MKYLFLLLSTLAFAQQTKFVDFKSVSAQLTLDTKDKAVAGSVNYWFDVLKPIDTIKIDAQNMSFTVVKLNNKIVPFINTTQQLQIIFPFKNGKNEISFEYTATPKQALYFVGSSTSDDLQIWTQGQGRYTSNWFPSFDDVNEKVIFNIELAFDKDYQAISNGILSDKITSNNTTLWQYKMEKPMSSYLLMLAIGKFDKYTEKTKCGTNLELYLEHKDADRYETAYRYSVKIFDFLEKEIGVKYPWKVYKQIPVRDFLYAGMENTSATLFSNRYVVDSTGFEDRNYINVNAHELAHQWFGDLITAESGKHHWLQEGFATYYASLAERDIYGDDYFYSKLYETAQQIKYASRTDTIPVLNEKASSLSFYQKGAWALFVLHEAIGDKVFKKVVRNYLEKHSFQNVKTQDFFDEVNKFSDFDTDNFSKVWLESTVFNEKEINELLSKNKTAKLLLELDKLKKTPLSGKVGFMAEILQSDAYYTVKEAVVNQLRNETFKAKKQLLELALATNNVQVRQAVAATNSTIPEDFRIQYQSLLSDKSYQTQEIALFYLWNNFPEQRSAYVEQSKDWVGFSDHNLKTLWLSLALSTPEYEADKTALIAELINYSSSNYEAITRQKALEKLIGFQLINDAVLKNLVNATTHHMWQFSKFGRDNIRKLLKDKEMVLSFERILPELDEKERFQLSRLLN